MDKTTEKFINFKKELVSLINRYSMENGCDTPDHILADYMINCLIAAEQTVKARDLWYGYKPWPDPYIADETLISEDGDLR
jgi:hypothetical protein